MEGTPVREQERLRSTPRFDPAHGRRDLERELARLIKEELHDAEAIVALSDNAAPQPQAGVTPGRSGTLVIPILFEGKVYGTVGIVSTSDEPQPSLESLEAVRQIVYLSSPFIACLREVENRIEALEKQSRDLSAILEMRVCLESNVAHELRTPMAAIRGYARMILDDRAGEINETQRDYLTIINDNSTRLIRQVAWMTHVSDRLAKQFEVSTFDLRDLWLECVKGQEEFLTEKNIRIEQQLSDESFAMIGDRGKLLQAFSQIISVLANSMGECGSITLELSHGRDRGIVGKISSSVPVTVSFDSGFSGLSELHDIVGMHGGRFFVNNKAGVGSTFLFTLPAVTLDGEGSFRNEQAVNSGRR